MVFIQLSYNCSLYAGITYGKGASVLKQLVLVVTMDGFKAGMQHYFKKHAWGNTTIGDFLSAIEVGAKKPLTDWSKLWLETSGLNTLSPVWQADVSNRIIGVSTNYCLGRKHL